MWISHFTRVMFEWNSIANALLTRWLMCQFSSIICHVIIVVSLTTTLSSLLWAYDNELYLLSAVANNLFRKTVFMLHCRYTTPVAMTQELALKCIFFVEKGYQYSILCGNSCLNVFTYLSKKSFMSNGWLENPNMPLQCYLYLYQIYFSTNISRYH